MKVTIIFEREDIEKLCQAEAARILKRHVDVVEVKYEPSYERSVTCTFTEPAEEEVEPIHAPPARIPFSTRDEAEAAGRQAHADAVAEVAAL